MDGCRVSLVKGKILDQEDAGLRQPLARSGDRSGEWSDMVQRSREDDRIHGLENEMDDLKPEQQDPDDVGDGELHPNPFATWEEFSHFLEEGFTEGPRYSKGDGSKTVRDGYYVNKDNEIFLTENGYGARDNTPLNLVGRMDERKDLKYAEGLFMPGRSPNGDGVGEIYDPHAFLYNPISISGGHP